MALLEDLIQGIDDPLLRERIADEVALLKKRKKFGLVFEGHEPEFVTVRAPIRVGSRVTDRTRPSDLTQYTVVSLAKVMATLRADDTGDELRARASDLLVVKPFGDPVYPGLSSLGSVMKGGTKPAHAVINGENFHVLHALLATHASKVDLIYLDPPYNTLARDWKYNNRFIDENDGYRHSKWLSMMDKRLRLARALLKPDGVMVVTIDKNELHHLGLLLEDVMRDFKRQVVTIVMNPSGDSSDGFSRVDEYAVFCFRDGLLPSQLAIDLLDPDDSVTKGTKIRWESLMRGGQKWYRNERRNLCYPIEVDVRTRRAVSVGSPLEGQEGARPLANGRNVLIWPTRDDGRLGIWRVEAETLRTLFDRGLAFVSSVGEGGRGTIRYVLKGTIDAIDSGEIEIQGTDEATGKAILARRVVRRFTPKTVWKFGAHTAGGSGGSLLLASLLGRRGAFDYPKSVYAVADTIASFVAERADATIVDFFAGSGTTLHAVALLNAQDGGSRRSILVTNNDVSEQNAKELHDDTFFLGDPEFESKGIFESVTRPRVEAAITGLRPDGKPVVGSASGEPSQYRPEYLLDHALADGLAENVEFFRLEYLDRDAIELGYEFDRIAPLLWMQAGAVGQWEAKDTTQPWSAPADSTYAVLFDTGRLADFVEMVEDRKRITHVWVETQSQTIHQELKALLPDHVVGVEILAGDYLRHVSDRPSESLEMNIPLKEFQEETVEDLVGAVRHAAEGAHRKPQTVVLSAPTGAGKTVMATALIERILEGDAEDGPNADATFLWLSDQPRINQQSKTRMLEVSSVLDDLNTVLVDYHFDQETFDAGKLYFLNIQKLGKEKKLITPGDRRSHTIWETINNTIEDRPASFYMIIDEAHRGVNGSGVNGQQTIVKSFLFGSDELRPLPVAIGISATPQKFQKLVDGTQRTLDTIEVPPEAVRESGLIKDQIVLRYNADDQLTEFTLLEAAATAWKRYTEEWAAYCAVEGESLVEPKLIVQVEDKPTKSSPEPTRTDLGECIATINDALGTPLKEHEFAHSFSEEGTIVTGGHNIRHVNAENISSDPTVKVVFFKTALSTGWDCPPAEVMMSFRPAKDEFYIAQLIGRMVRTPLARQIADNEFLNSVDLFLPFYDDVQVDKIVARLTSDDEYVPPTSVTKQSVSLKRAPGTEELFDGIQRLPSFTIPRRTKPRQTHRLLKLAAYLARDKIDEGAIEAAERHVVAVLGKQLASRQADVAFKQGIDGKAVVDIGHKVFGIRTQEVESLADTRVSATNRDIDRVFTQAGKRIGEGLHETFWRHLTRKVDPTTSQGLEKLRIAKNTVVVLLANGDVLDAVESAAEQQVDAWLSKHQRTIDGLKEDARDRYTRIRGAVTQPTMVTNRFPAIIEMPVPDKAVEIDRHIYIPETGKFQTGGTTLEKALLGVELGDSEIVGWLRNIDRKPWALCIAYERRGEWRGLYPDFLFFRRDNGQVRIDLIDPHTTSYEDAAAKAKGLAIYTRDHGHHFGRIEMVDEIEGTIRRLDVKNSKVRGQLLTVTNSEQLQAVYKAHGKPLTRKP